MDFGCLVVHLQVVFAICAAFDLQNRVGLGFLFTLMLGIVLGMWVGGVSCASKAGIVHPWKRAFLVLCLLPFTLAAMVAIPFCVITTVHLIVSFRAADSGGRIAACVAILLVVAILCWKIRDAAKWVLRGSAYDSRLVNKPIKEIG